MRPRCLVASVWAMTWLAACAGGADDAAAPSGTVPTSSSAPPSTSATLVATTTTTVATSRPGVDERRGTADGDTWVLTTRTTEVEGELCLQLVWEGDDQGWSSCYVVDQGMGDLPWVDPYLQHHDDTPVHFLVGLAPLGARSVEARRGATTMGVTDVFPGDTLHLGRLGFAMPLPVPDAAAVTRAVHIPGLDVTAVVGVLPPLEVVASGADGVEVARGGRLIGAVVDVPTLVLGDDPATATTMLLSPTPAPGGFVMPWSQPPRYGFVVVAAGATYEVSTGGRSTRGDLIPVPGATSPAFLAAVMVQPDTAMSTTFTILDGAGNVLETVALGQYLGG